MTGQTISHYRILEKLGEGAMGAVYKAEDTKLKRTVALKFLLKQEPELRERFLREAQAAAALHHPNICTLFEIDEERGFLAMEFVEGPTLKEKIKERPLKLEEALEIAGQVCEGLAEAHAKGIVHRDIKPGNILLTLKRQVKITDFGLAAIGGQTRITISGTSLGTPAYMSPEQARGLETDRRTDIWSLAVVLYEMVSGRLPFSGESQHAVNYAIVNENPEPLTALRTGVPLELDRIVAKALAKDAAERYSHVEDLNVDLQRLRKASPRQQDKPARKRWGAIAVAVTAGLGCAALAAILLLWRRTAAPPPPAEYVQITSFTDSATQPSLSADGRMITFIRGPYTFNTPGQIYVKLLPNGEPVQLTKDATLKMSPVFSPNGTRVAYTVVTPSFSWDTWAVPVLGGEAREWLPNPA